MCAAMASAGVITSQFVFGKGEEPQARITVELTDVPNSNEHIRCSRTFADLLPVRLPSTNSRFSMLLT